MKKLTSILFLLSVALSVFAQKTDWVNAPMNPIALQYKKEHFNLKGDVYAHKEKVFSKDGMLIYEYGISEGLHYLYKNGLLYEDTDGKLYEFNNKRLLVKHTYAYSGIQTKTFLYNSADLLVSVKNTQGYSADYEYDDKGRLIISNVRGDIKGFSYQKKGDQLIVIEKDLSKNPVVTTKYIYKNGVEIGRNDQLFKINYDKFGNPSGFESAIYYSDVDNRNNEIAVVYTKPSSAAINLLFNCKFYINGQKVDFLFKEIVQRKDLLVYSPFTEKYYIIENAFDNAKSGQKQVFAKVLVNSPYALRNSKDSSPMLNYKGAFLGNTTNGMRDGALKVYKAPVYLVYDKTLNQTFYGDLDNANTSGYYPLQPISPQDNVVFIKNENNQFLIIIEGKLYSKENSTYKLSSLQNGASLIKDEKGNPLYYLPGTAKATSNKLYPGRKYNPATDKSELVDKASSAPTNSSATTATYFRPFKSVDISNKVLSAEVETFFKSYNTNPNNIAEYVTNIETTLKQKNYTGQATYTKLTEILTEIYAIDRYAVFRIMMVVDKAAFNATLKLIPLEMRKYLSEEARFKIQREKEMNTTQR